MKSTSVRTSDGEEEKTVIPDSQTYLEMRKRSRQLFGSDSEDEFLAPQRVPRKRCRIISPKRGKIAVHKVEIVRPPRVEEVQPEVGVVLISDDDATQMNTPERVITPDIDRLEIEPETQPGMGAKQPQQSEVQPDVYDDIFGIRTPERAITPDIIPFGIPSDTEWEPEAQPLVLPEELELVGDNDLFTGFPCFEVMCGTAKTSVNYVLPQEFTAGGKNKTRMMRSSYVAVDRYARKFVSAGLNPHTGFKPVVCFSFDTSVYVLKDFQGFVEHLRTLKVKLTNTLAPADRVVRECTDFRSTLMRGRRVKLTVHNTGSWRRLDAREYFTLSAEEVDNVIECEKYVLKKVEILQSVSGGVARKYLQYIQRVAITTIMNGVSDVNVMREYLRKEILSEENSILNDVLWEVYIYHSEKLTNHLKHVIGFMKANDMFVCKPENKSIFYL